MPTEQESLSSSLDPFDPKKILDPKTTSLDKQDISGLDEALSSPDKTQKLFKEIKNLMGNQMGSFRNRMDHLMYQYISGLQDSGEKTQALQTYALFLNQGKSEFSNNADWDETIPIDVRQMENYLRQRSERYNVIYVPAYKKRLKEYKDIEGKNYHINIYNIKLREEQEEYEEEMLDAIDYLKDTSRISDKKTKETIRVLSDENKKLLIQAAIDGLKEKNIMIKTNKGEILNMRYTIHQGSVVDALQTSYPDYYKKLIQANRTKEKIKKTLSDEGKFKRTGEGTQVLITDDIDHDEVNENNKKFFFIKEILKGTISATAVLSPIKKPTGNILPWSSLPTFTAPEFTFRSDIQSIKSIDIKNIEPKDIIADTTEQLRTLQDQMQKQTEKEENELNELFDYGQKKIFQEDSPTFLNKEIEGNLDEVAAYLRSHSDKKILIVGYHGNGKEKIAEDRAEAVKEYLVKQGIDEKRISAKKSDQKIAQSISIEIL